MFDLVPNFVRYWFDRSPKGNTDTIGSGGIYTYETPKPEPEYHSLFTPTVRVKKSWFTKSDPYGQDK